MMTTPTIQPSVMPMLQAALPIAAAELDYRKTPENEWIISLSFICGNASMDRQSIEFCLYSSSWKWPQQEFRNRIVDIYPLNGTAKNEKFNISKFFRKNHREELQGHLEALALRDPYKNNIRCMVIDFKDTGKNYNKAEEVRKTEDAFVAFFKNTPKGEPQQSIRKLVNDNGIHYFIKEGTLKADLLEKIFTVEQSAYLQTEKGAVLFCQLCEIIMNGFKMGREALVNGRFFSPAEYISEGKTEPPLQMQNRPVSQELSLLTFYPQHYKEVYSETSEYYKLINKIHKVNHELENNTTLITLRV